MEQLLKQGLSQKLFMTMPVYWDSVVVRAFYPNRSNKLPFFHIVWSCPESQNPLKTKHHKH
ncbi:hypothetical protein AZI98_06775 [Aeribacillus pallidus]|uniref:Uncharacterized protein n=1 Tax=Aeribacillus pallidus TaxID=33936 RepID=A0A165Y833_9BACI|nr:hypothetical protein AZI98_06775 [Aeribacillus pallidus]